VVDEITPKVVEDDGERKSVAVIGMKLDKTVEPLATDTTIKVRPRSALGLKYVEVIPGSAKATYTAGDTVPLRNSSEGLELEDVFSTLDEETRENSRSALEGFGDAFAARGTSINTAIQAFNPFFKSLQPVMTSLSDPDTQLDQFFVQLGRAAAQVAPVASVQADLFSNMATTFAAISSDPASLQATIEKSPSTLDVATRSFRVQRPFLADFADLSRRLRPAVNELPRSLPAINRAFRVGIPVLPRTVDFNNRTRRALLELEDLFENPNTLLTIRDLRTTLAVTRPALEFITPYQTVCNYANYFFHSLGEHWSTTVQGGTVQAQGLKTVNTQQPNSFGDITASRPWDVPPGVDPIGASAMGMKLGRTYATPYQPAIDAQGNADCQNGQVGFIRGPLAPNVRYPPGLAPDGSPSGANAGVLVNNFPILSGGTFKSRELGIDNLEDVDKLR
jgi:ABC-type transporter Mla subunit MlaD